MIKVSSESLPKIVINDLAYLIYYSIYGFLVSTWFFLIWIWNWDVKLDNDYQLFLLSIIVWLSWGIICKFLKSTPEQKIIKRNIFTAWLISILKKQKYKTITFDKVFSDYAYCVFQNRKVTCSEDEWTTYVEALIALDIIELVNHKDMLKRSKKWNFDYKCFKKNLTFARIKLIDENVNIDELIKRLDNYIL